MTTGHKHRTVQLDRSGWRYRLLQLRVARTQSVERADRSRFVWRPDPDDQGYYELRLLGALHGLFGLTVVSRGDDHHV